MPKAAAPQEAPEGPPPAPPGVCVLCGDSTAGDEHLSVECSRCGTFEVHTECGVDYLQNWVSASHSNRGAVAKLKVQARQRPRLFFANEGVRCPRGRLAGRKAAAAPGSCVGKCIGAEAVKPQKEPPPPLPVIQPTRRAPRQPAGGRKQGQPGKAPARQAGQGGGVPGYGRGGSTFEGGYDYSWDEDDSGEERSAPRPLDLGAFLNLPGGKDSETAGEEDVEDYAEQPGEAEDAGEDAGEHWQDGPPGGPAWPSLADGPPAQPPGSPHGAAEVPDAQPQPAWSAAGEGAGTGGVWSRGAANVLHDLKRAACIQDLRDCGCSHAQAVAATDATGCDIELGLQLLLEGRLIEEVADAQQALDKQAAEEEKRRQAQEQQWQQRRAGPREHDWGQASPGELDWGPQEPAGGEWGGQSGDWGASPAVAAQTGGHGPGGGRPLDSQELDWEGAAAQQGDTWGTAAGQAGWAGAAVAEDSSWGGGEPAQQGSWAPGSAAEDSSWPAEVAASPSHWATEHATDWGGQAGAEDGSWSQQASEEGNGGAQIGREHIDAGQQAEADWEHGYREAAAEVWESDGHSLERLDDQPPLGATVHEQGAYSPETTLPAAAAAGSDTAASPADAAAPGMPKHTGAAGGLTAASANLPSLVSSPRYVPPQRRAAQGQAHLLSGTRAAHGMPPPGFEAATCPGAPDSGLAEGAPLPGSQQLPAAPPDLASARGQLEQAQHAQPMPFGSPVTPAPGGVPPLPPHLVARQAKQAAAPGQTAAASPGLHAGAPTSPQFQIAAYYQTQPLGFSQAASPRAPAEWQQPGGQLVPAGAWVQAAQGWVWQAAIPVPSNQHAPYPVSQAQHATTEGMPAGGQWAYQQAKQAQHDEHFMGSAPHVSQQDQLQRLLQQNGCVPSTVLPGQAAGGHHGHSSPVYRAPSQAQQQRTVVLAQKLSPEAAAMGVISKAPILPPPGFAYSKQEPSQAAAQHQPPAAASGAIVGAAAAKPNPNSPVPTSRPPAGRMGSTQLSAAAPAYVPVELRTQAAAGPAHAQKASPDGQGDDYLSALMDAMGLS